VSDWSLCAHVRHGGRGVTMVTENPILGTDQPTQTGLYGVNACTNTHTHTHTHTPLTHHTTHTHTHTHTPLHTHTHKQTNTFGHRRTGTHTHTALSIALSRDSPPLALVRCSTFIPT